MGDGRLTTVEWLRGCCAELMGSGTAQPGRLSSFEVPLDSKEFPRGYL